MASKFLEVDPKLIWEKGKKAEDVKIWTGGHLIKPWSNLRELPEFSYKTSYQVGFPQQYEFEKYFVPPAKLDIPQIEEKYKYEVFKNQYQTTTGSTYVKKTIKVEPGEKPSFLEYLDSMRDRFQKKMYLVPSISTEISSNYKLHTYDPTLSGVYKDQLNEIYCDPQTLTKRMQPCFEPSDGGARIEKDIYQSQSHYAHHYFPPKKVKIARQPLAIPESGIKVYTNPNPLDPFMRLPFRQVNLREKVLTVPHRGMITEFQENYIPQVDIFALNDTPLQKRSSVIKPGTKENMIKEMDRFHTEYNHIGNNWSTQNI